MYLDAAKEHARRPDVWRSYCRGRDLFIWGRLVGLDMGESLARFLPIVREA